MCGICGLVRAQPERWSGRARAADEALVARMSERLVHRGPDGHGLVSQGAAVFGHRRLAVIDLTSAAAQPMISPGGRHLLSYNGEVYDYLELGRELGVQQGGDTAVVLAALARWGEQALLRFNGMFALALWDADRQELLLARDRYGQKPLYYAELEQGGLAFASELRGLRQLPELAFELDRLSIAKYLALDVFPGATTPYRGVHKLPPGHLLRWRPGQAPEVERWAPRRHYSVARPSPAEAAEEIRRRLWRAVERRLVSDVPVGVFLSGGIDSSAILAAAVDHLGADQVQTFSVGFASRTYDESQVARETARLLGTQHHERTIDDAELLKLVDPVLDHLDEPLADVSIIPTSALARFARERITVALGGEGGDELFAGYDTFVAERAARPLAALPRRLRRHLPALANLLPTSGGRASLEFRARRFLGGLAAPGAGDPAVRAARWFGSFLPEELSGVLQLDLSSAELSERIYEDVVPDERLSGPDRQLELWARFLLPEMILAKADRATMAVSLEARAPFMDPELAHYVEALPYDFKLRGLERKWILKQALRGPHPRGVRDEVLDRRKQGFNAPNAEWLRGPLYPAAEALLSAQALAGQDLLQAEAVGGLLEAHRRGQRDARKQLWALFVLGRWLQTALPNPAI